MSAKQPTLTGYKYEERITGKIILMATLRNTSPLLLGSGLSDIADKEIIRLPDGKPYIPASALAGKLRRKFKDIYSAEDKTVRQFWGGNLLSGRRFGHRCRRARFQESKAINPENSTEPSTFAITSPLFRTTIQPAVELQAPSMACGYDVLPTYSGLLKVKHTSLFPAPTFHGQVHC